jgi:GT2 family glycosyltransferase
MKVSAVIATYQGQHLLQNNLPAVVKALRNQDEVIIVDDASPKDDGLKWVQDKFAPVKSQKVKTQSKDDYTLSSWDHKIKGSKSKTITFKFIKNKTNLRFGGNCNRGVELASGDLIFLLNNDVSPDKDVLKYLLPYFKDEDVFSVSCLEKEQSSDKTKSVQYHGKNVLWFERGIFMHNKAADFKKGETAWGTGGSSMIDRGKFLELGGFDKLYFPAYWEDIDLSWRAKEKGWKILFEPKAKVDHNHESTNQSVFGHLKMLKLGWKNSDRFTWRHADLWQKLAFILWRPYWWWHRSKLSR